MGKNTIARYHHCTTASSLQPQSLALVWAAKPTWEETQTQKLWLVPLWAASRAWANLYQMRWRTSPSCCSTDRPQKLWVSSNQLILGRMSIVTFWMSKTLTVYLFMQILTFSPCLSPTQTKTKRTKIHASVFPASFLLPVEKEKVTQVFFNSTVH